MLGRHGLPLGQVPSVDEAQLARTELSFCSAYLFLNPDNSKGSFCFIRLTETLRFYYKRDRLLDLDFEDTVVRTEFCDFAFRASTKTKLLKIMLSVQIV